MFWTLLAFTTVISVVMIVVVGVTEMVFQAVATDKTQIWITLINNLPSMIASLVAAVVAFLAYLQSKTNARTAAATQAIAIETKQTTNDTAIKTDKLTDHVNGMQTQLLAATEAKGQAEGKLDALAATSDNIPAGLAIHSPTAVFTKALTGIEGKLDEAAQEAAKVALNLEDSQKRADAARHDVTGESADAAARTPPKEEE